MKRLFDSFPSLFVIFLLLFNCSEQKTSEITKTEAEREVIQNIQQRFAINNYENKIGYNKLNPHNNIGKHFGEMYHEVSKNRKPKIYASRPSESLFSFASLQNSKINKPISDDATLGISDPNLLNTTVNTIIVHFDGIGTPMEKNDLLAANNKMNQYEFNRNGIIRAINDRIAVGSISAVAAEIVKTELQELSAANSFTEAMQINATIEAEVLNSNLEENDSRQLLAIVACVKGISPFAVSNSNYGFQFGDDKLLHKTTAPVVLGIIIGAIVGAIFANQPGNCTPNDPLCQYVWMAGGAALGGIGGALIEAAFVSSED